MAGRMVAVRFALRYCCHRYCLHFRRLLCDRVGLADRFRRATGVIPAVLETGLERAVGDGDPDRFLMVAEAFDMALNVRGFPGHYQPPLRLAASLRLLSCRARQRAAASSATHRSQRTDSDQGSSPWP